MTKANKTVLIIFAHAYIRIDQTPPPPCHSVTLNGPSPLH